jgi:hypothetical protein
MVAIIILDLLFLNNVEIRLRSSVSLCKALSFVICCGYNLSLNSCKIGCHCDSSTFEFVVPDSDNDDHWWFGVDIENNVYRLRCFVVFIIKCKSKMITNFVVFCYNIIFIPKLFSIFLFFRLIIILFLFLVIPNLVFYHGCEFIFCTLL